MSLLTFFVLVLCLAIVGLLIYNDKLYEGKASAESLLQITQDSYNILTAEKADIERRLGKARVSEDVAMTILRELVRLERIREINPEEYERGRAKAWALAFHHAEQDIQTLLGGAATFYEDRTRKAWAGTLRRRGPEATHASA